MPGIVQSAFLHFSKMRCQKKRPYWCAKDAETSFQSERFTKMADGGQQRFIKELKWMAAKLGIIPDNRIGVEKDKKIVHEGKKAFYAGEYRKCRKILGVRNCKNPRKAWQWLNSLSTTEKFPVTLPSGLVRESLHRHYGRDLSASRPPS